MKIEIRFMTLNGPFRTATTRSFASLQEALAGVRAYVEPFGFSNVKTVHDDDPGEVRFIARTPNGRAGRNVAFGSYDCCEET